MMQGETSGWIWVLLVFVVLLLLSMVCCFGTLFGGLIGFSIGAGSVRSMDAPPAYPYPLPLPPEPPQGQGEAWLGVAFQMVDEGALVAVVVPESPAEEAGLREGDIIVRVDGFAVTASMPLDEHVVRYAPGQRIQIAILRDGQSQSITVHLTERPGGSPEAPRWDG